jgi:ribosomal protein L37AE/L43A
MASDILSAAERRADDVNRGKIRGPNVYQCPKCKATHEVADEAEAAMMRDVECPFCDHIGYVQRDE